MKRTTKPLSYENKPIRSPFGSYMPHPPKHCEKRLFFVVNDEIQWLDVSICHNCSGIKKCKERKVYLMKLKMKRKKRNEI